MQEASFYEPKTDLSVVCLLCPWKCTIGLGKRGVCQVRKNVDGKLVSLVYGKPCSMSIDPMEKKPFYHFYPGHGVLSLGTFGCNLFCEGCQNFDISKGDIEQHEFMTVTPQDIVQRARTHHLKLIAFTYNEPTMFFEYMLDIAKIAKKAGMKTVVVSNGYINPEPLQELCKYVDAFNIDLKFFSEKKYKAYCKTSLAPVLASLKTIHDAGCWLEITNLLIEDLNDMPDEVEHMSHWIQEHLGEDTPLHFSRFFPMYKALDRKTTNLGTLETAKTIADKHLRYVYVGNIRTQKYENTYCWHCERLLIKRVSFDIIENHITRGSCPYCTTTIAGVW